MFLEYYLAFFPLLLMLVAFIPFYITTTKLINYVLLLSTLLLICSLLVFRDINAPTDMNNYSWMYSYFSSFETAVTESYQGSLVFTLLIYIGNLLSLDREIFFYLYSIACLVNYCIGLSLILRNFKHYLLALSFFGITSTFVLLLTNVLRQGLALSLLIISIGLILNERRFLGIIFLLLSCLSHTSMILIAVLLTVVPRLTKDAKTIFNLFFALGIPSFIIIRSGYLNVLLSASQQFQFYSEEFEYDNHLIVYSRIAIMCVSSVIFYIYGTKFSLFDDQAYSYIFKIYVLIQTITILTLPALLVSARFAYYGGGIMPILFTYLFYSKSNLIESKTRHFLFSVISICYGYFVYSFPSVRLNLGL